MGLILTSTKDKKIKMHGLSIELPSVYIRLKPYFSFDGKTIESDMKYFENKLSFTQDSENIPMDLKIVLQDSEGQAFIVNSFKSVLEATEIQSLETVHKYAKQAFENAGYKCEIVL